MRPGQIESLGVTLGKIGDLRSPHSYMFQVAGGRRGSKDVTGGCVGTNEVTGNKGHRRSQGVIKGGQRVSKWSKEVA